MICKPNQNAWDSVNYYTVFALNVWVLPCTVWAQMIFRELQGHHSSHTGFIQKCNTWLRCHWNGIEQKLYWGKKTCTVTHCPTRRHWKWSTGCCQFLYQLFLIFHAAELFREVHSFHSLSQSYNWFRKSMPTLQLWTVSHLSGNTVVCWQKLISLILSR